MIPLRTLVRAPFRFLAAMWRTLQFIAEGRPVVAPKKEHDFRLSECAKCPKRHGGLCSLCACFIDAKTLLSAEQCPDNPPRWTRMTIYPN